MSINATTQAGRDFAEQQMVDECVIERQIGSTLDPNTGADTPTYATIYTGKCRLQLRLVGGSSDVGEQRVDMLAAELQLPITVAGIHVNDTVRFTNSLDPELAAPRADGTTRRFRVANLMHKTHATARRLSVEEITS